MAIYTKKDENGKVLGYYFNAYYKDSFGNRKRKHSGLFAKKKDCEQAEREFKNEITAKTVPSSMTVNELRRIYIADKAKEVDKPRLKNIEYVSTFLTDKVGNLKVSQITTLMMREWFDEICKMNYSISYKNGIKKQAKQIFSYAVDLNVIHTNPLLSIRNVKATSRALDDIEDIKSHIITEEEFLNAIDVLYAKDYVYYVLLNVLFYTGLRVGEVKALTPNDIDFENNQITVNKSLSQHSKKPTLPKTPSSIRTVIFDNKLKDLLITYINFIKRIHGYSDNCFLFGIKTYISDTSIRRKWDKAIAHGNLKHLTIHDLRHCRASYLICNGFNIAFVSRQLGHANTSITLKVYTELMKDTAENEAKRLIEMRK